MKNLTIITTTLLITLLVSSCSVVGDIFGAGMNFGIFITLFIIAVVIYAIFRMTRRKS